MALIIEAPNEVFSLENNENIKLQKILNRINND